MSRKLLLQWDPEIDGAFQRRFEQALRDLQIDYADIAAVDPDDEAHAILVLAAPHSRVPHRSNDVPVILAGPGKAEHANGHLRLEAADIDNRTRRWLTTAEKLGAKLGRPGLAAFAEADSDASALKSAALAFPSDPLAKDAAISLQPAVLHDQLASEKRRADEAEEKRAAALRAQDHAANQLKLAEQQRFVAQMEAKKLTAELDRLAAINETSAYAITKLSAADRAIVEQARDHTWRARLAATLALEAAERHPETLRWKNGATYSGETRNGYPHGYGVMTFRADGKDTATYRGQFDMGARIGHGAAHADGCTWSGQFANNEASGFGLLESASERFEGEVAPREDGAPRKVRGYSWRTDAQRVHEPMTALLPPR